VLSTSAQANQARDLVAADCVIALGGGSTIGLGKAIAARTSADQIVIPTTYAGSEMTPILGETVGGRKTTRVDPSILPETAIYDVDLTLTLPVGLSVTSGMNAMAHALEALYARERSPIVSMIANEAVRALARALPAIADGSNDHFARSEALYGAWLCGMSLGSVGMALHHKLCHVLGGRFNLPHAETHTVLLPYTIGFNAEAVPDLLCSAAEALGSDRIGAAIFDLLSRIGAPTAPRAIGMPEDGIQEGVELALQNPYWNPRPFDRAVLHALLAAAWHGERPV
jgi:alcohol dehydrogenase class IV